ARCPPRCAAGRSAPARRNPAPILRWPARPAGSPRPARCPRRRPRRLSAPTWLEPVRIGGTDAGRGERAAGRAVLREDLLEQRQCPVRVVVLGGGVELVQPGRQ